MRIPNRLPQKMIGFLVLFIACGIPTQALPQTDQVKDKAPVQEKKSEEKKPEATAKGGGIEILSDTMGVDFGPYMKRLKYTVQSHWDMLIPEVALPPINKSGTVVIELAIMQNGQVTGMKLVESSGDLALDRAAWGGITNGLPMPTLPSEFKGDHLSLRLRFFYNPDTKPAQQPALIGKVAIPPQPQVLRVTTGIIETLSDHAGLEIGTYTKLILDKMQSRLQPLLQKTPPEPGHKSVRVIIEFSILRNGTVKDVKFKKSSGDETVDHAVRDAIQSAAPYQVLPQQFKGKLLKLRWYMDIW